MGSSKRKFVLRYSLLSRASSSSSSLLLSLVFLSLLSFTALILVRNKVDDIVSRTKTVAGHNLEPTPWHRFRAAPLKQSIGDDDEDDDNSDSVLISRQRWWNRWWGWYPRAAKSRIFHCSYLLTCPPPPPHSRLNTTILQYQQKPPSPSLTSSSSCPSIFRWIHHDLSPWSRSRISFSNLMQAREHAAFRVIISDGRLFVDFYYACVQTRAMFTIWGFLQLLRRYPGLIPDVDLMFDCMDRPVIRRSQFKPRGRWPPPPLFRYCTTNDHFDIPFPDWSFWGWPEVNIGPWDEEFRSIKLGSQELNWAKKARTAYWKGNPDVGSPVRSELLRCNNSETWGALIMRQDWVQEERQGFRQSKLSSQCNHRYKIYAEGFAWSVSLKYIISCSSLALIIRPQFEDFFSRELMPRKNYWPITHTNLCPSIKFAVDWGNEHPPEAEAIGKAGQDFMQNLNMERVYDYMYHLLVEYSKLQDFVPTLPSSAQEICEDSVLCFADGKQRHLLKRSSASPSSSLPCSLPDTDHHLIQTWMQDKQKIIDGIQKLEIERAKNETVRI